MVCSFLLFFGGGVGGVALSFPSFAFESLTLINAIIINVCIHEYFVDHVPLTLTCRSKGWSYIRS